MTIRNKKEKATLPGWILLFTLILTFIQLWPVHKSLFSQAFPLQLEAEKGVSEDREKREDLLAAPVLKLQDVLKYALRENPQIQAFKENWQGAKEIPKQVSAYDDPVVSWVTWNIPRDFELDKTGTHIYRITQKIPFPGKLGLKAEIAEREADIVGEDYQDKRLEVISRAKSAYYELFLVDRNMEIYNEDKDLAEQFARIAESRYRLGLAAQTDVLRAQVELARLINLTITEGFKLETAGARLNVLLDRTPDAPLGKPLPPQNFTLDDSFESLLQMTLENSPELKQAKLTIERSKAAISLARRQYYPDFQFSFDRFENRFRRDGFGAMVSVSIPLPFKSKYDAGVSQARAALNSSQASYRELKNRAFFLVKEAWIEVKTAQELIKLFRFTHIPQAEQTLKSTEGSYKTGKVDFLALIDSLRVLEDFRLGYYRAITDFGTKLAKLERVVGLPLTR